MFLGVPIFKHIRVIHSRHTIDLVLFYKEQLSPFNQSQTSNSASNFRIIGNSAKCIHDKAEASLFSNQVS